MVKKRLDGWFMPSYFLFIQNKYGLMANHKKIFFVFLIVLGLVASLGCINSEDNKDTQQIQTTQIKFPSVPEPSKTIDLYVFSFNKMQFGYIYDNLLSNELKKGKSKDDVHNLLNAYRTQGIDIVEYNIIDKTGLENITKMEIEFVWSIDGYRKTETKNVTLVLEDDSWKISDNLIILS